MLIVWMFSNSVSDERQLSAVRVYLENVFILEIQLSQFLRHVKELFNFPLIYRLQNILLYSSLCHIR